MSESAYELFPDLLRFCRPAPPAADEPDVEPEETVQRTHPDPEGFAITFGNGREEDDD